MLMTTMVTALSISAITGCSAQSTGSKVTEVAKQEETTAASQEPSASAEEESVVDLGGMEIIIGDWWSTGEEAEPTTAQEEATREYRKMIQEKYNFTIKQVALGNWDTYQETFTVSTMAEDPAAQVFIMPQRSLAQPLSNGLLYDLATLDNFDFTEDKWNQGVIELMSQGDSVYGMKSGKAEPKLGVFWNKRLFEEAGLNPDLPYDLQASGEWTWEKFEELCMQLTQDKDNDGVIDIYAMVSFSCDLYPAAVLSNNAKWVGKDENGKYYNATTTPEFLEAMQWATGLIEKGYEMSVPEDANWDWFISAFHDAKAAMTVAEEYKVGTWSDMDDDYGFVLFPKGPRNTDYATNVMENISVIPACYDKETAEKIAFAYNLYTNPTPGYEEDDDWKSFYYTMFRDERAVDETLTRMFEPGVGRTDSLPMVYGLSLGDICYNVYGLIQTPAEKIEEVSGTWQALIDDANK